MGEATDESGSGKPLSRLQRCDRLPLSPPTLRGEKPPTVEADDQTHVHTPRISDVGIGTLQPAIPPSTAPLSEEMTISAIYPHTNGRIPLTNGSRISRMMETR